MLMKKEKKSVDYSELIARTAEEEKVERNIDTAMPPADAGVDYEMEYRKQTGKDLSTGEIVVQ